MPTSYSEGKALRRGSVITCHALVFYRQCATVARSECA